jgi:hypothetical protein
MDVWSDAEKEFFTQLKGPKERQKFLDDIPYDSIGKTNRSPRYVIKERRANCFEGALLAAATLEFHGNEPLIVDMMAHNDDDHLIAVYKMFGRWGAVAKSNNTTLRNREPVYESIRELVMSYFDVYFNNLGEKTLRAYTNELNLNMFNKYDWRQTCKNLDLTIGNRLNTIKHYPILSRDMEANLSKAHPLLLKAALLGSDPSGLYKPEKVQEENN